MGFRSLVELDGPRNRKLGLSRQAADKCGFSRREGDGRFAKVMARGVESAGRVAAGELRENERMES